MRYLETGAPPENVTVSSDGGGCLPVFDEQGEMLSMDIGSPASLAATLKRLLDRGVPLENALPAFTSNVARLLRLHDKGFIDVNASADFVVLDDRHRISDVMIGGVWHVKDGKQEIAGTFE